MATCVYRGVIRWRNGRTGDDDDDDDQEAVVILMRESEIFSGLYNYDIVVIIVVSSQSHLCRLHF